MALPTAVDLIKVAEAHGKAAHNASIAVATEQAFAEAVIAEELGLGADRSTDSIGIHDDMNHYPHAALWSEAFATVMLHSRSVQEMLIRLANPSERLVISNNPYFLLKLDIGNVTIANNIHLDYMERHHDISGSEYNVISMQDIEAGSFATTYDMAIVGMPLIRHDFGLIDTIYGQLPTGGSIIFTSSNDHGKLFFFNNAHDYSAVYEHIKDLVGAHLYHTPGGLGISVLTKTV